MARCLDHAYGNGVCSSFINGRLAHLVEHLFCKREAVGAKPTASIQNAGVAQWSAKASYGFGRWQSTQPMWVARLAGSIPPAGLFLLRKYRSGLTERSQKPWHLLSRWFESNLPHSYLRARGRAVKCDGLRNRGSSHPWCESRRAYLSLESCGVAVKHRRL